MPKQALDKITDALNQLQTSGNFSARAHSGEGRNLKESSS